MSVPYPQVKPMARYSTTTGGARRGCDHHDPAVPDLPCRRTQQQPPLPLIQERPDLSQHTGQPSRKPLLNTRK
jgi:hypothetical protein